MPQKDIGYLIKNINDKLKVKADADLKHSNLTLAQSRVLTFLASQDGQATQKEIEIFLLKNNKKRNLLGIAVGTKNGKAFQRNKAKRLIRECYTRLEEQLVEGNNIVILMNKKFCIDNIQFSEIFNDMKNIFEEAKILNKEDEI